MTEEETDERPNALLTKKDREWLAADEPFYTGDSAAQQRYRRRRSIRDRVVASLGDFSLLRRELEESEREKIIDEFDMRTSEDTSGSVTMRLLTPGPPAISDALGFLYLLHEDTDQFELSLRRALSGVSKQRENTLYQEVSVEIDLDEWSREDIQSLKEKVGGGDTQALSRRERDFLIDHLNTDELSAALDRQINPPSTHPEDRDEFKWP